MDMTPQPNTNYVPRAAWELWRQYRVAITDPKNNLHEGLLEAFMLFYPKILDIPTGGNTYYLRLQAIAKHMDSAQPFPETEMWAVKDDEGRVMVFHDKNKAMEYWIVLDTIDKNDGNVYKVAIREVGGRGMKSRFNIVETRYNDGDHPNLGLVTAYEIYDSEAEEVIFMDFSKEECLLELNRLYSNGNTEQ